MNVLLNDALLRDEARRMVAALSHALPAEAEEPSGVFAERAEVLWAWCWRSARWHGRR